MLNKLYKFFFWIFIIAAIATSIFPLFGTLSETFFGIRSFKIRLDYLLHATGYLLFCLYYLVGQRLGIVLFKTNALLKFAGLMLILVIGTEIIQLWVPSRKFNPVDLIANTSGLVLGVIIIVISKKSEKTMR